VSVRSGPYDGPFLKQLLTCFQAAFSPAAILQLHARSYLGPQAQIRYLAVLSAVLTGA